ncbi:hypothetical protein B0F90DRAFT_1679663 [Multifurca ochricompacta]|uniref:NADH dehydrogenase subunit 4 n=1 Tax=Multifurca ochricompacta TaxID=376703 RepID=A0AAD4QQJ9_9AGAM|nr:hypothetical protein B0F90DRAFT_1679663 [Multifurca ochricompacta]
MRLSSYNPFFLLTFLFGAFVSATPVLPINPSRLNLTIIPLVLNILTHGNSMKIYGQKTCLWVVTVYYYLCVCC